MTSLEDVSRETIVDLRAYEALIQKWNPSINLIAKSTLSQLWERHVEDSALLFPHVPENATHLVDLGSGGGLPGLVLAILAKHTKPTIQTTLVESDQRKAAFLRTVSIEFDLDTRVMDQRIEQVNPLNANVVTARALAPLPRLLGYVHRHLRKDGLALLPKGKGHSEELAEAREIWEFEVKTEQLMGSDGSAILKVSNLREKHKNGS